MERKLTTLLLYIRCIYCNAFMRQASADDRLKKNLYKMSKFWNFMTICDMIKRNESDVGHIVFEILAKTVFNSFVLYCF